MTTKRFEIHVRKPPAEVFEFSTNPDHLPEWGDGVVRTRRLTEGPLQVGSKFAVQNSAADNGQEFVNEIIRYEPGQVFAFRTEGRMLTYSATRTYQGTAEGTLVSEELVIERAKGLYLVLHPLVTWIAARMHSRSLKNLKRQMESHGS